MEEGTLNKMKQKRDLVFIFMTIFLDIMGFGMVIPLSPILAREFGADGLQVGLLISIYSLTQFLSAPFWGRLSDVIGRKPVIIIGLFGVAFAHLWFAFSDTLTGLFLSRAVAGVFGGNITTAMAYIADVTGKKERSKNMGLIGMAFGLGFTLGPALGGLFILLGKQMGSLPPFGVHFASCGAALLEFANGLAAWIFLRESRQNKTLKDRPISYLSSFQKASFFSRPSLMSIWQSLKTPFLGQVLFISFILWMALAQIEPTLILLLQDDFQWTKTMAYWGFAYIGFLMAFSQGILVRRFIPSFGEREVNKWGLLCTAAGLIFMGVSVFAKSWPLYFGNGNMGMGLACLILAVTLFSVGYSLSNTSLSGALSLLSSSEEQGRIFGVNQSLASIARISGPALGGWLYNFSHKSPFFIAGIMAFGAWFLAHRLGVAFPNTGKKDSPGSNRASEEDLYFISAPQLENLITKRIHFHFFKLEDFSSEDVASPVLREFLQRMEIVREDQLDFQLKNCPKNDPLVLICKNGSLSKRLSKELRAKGYYNSYYIKEGIQGLEVSTD